MRASRTIAAAVLFACAGCARSSEDWRAGLESEDLFERGLSALALAHSAPAESADMIPHLLELVEGRDEWLATAAHAELAQLAPRNVQLLIDILAGTEGATPKFRSALCSALVAADSAAVGPLREHLFDAGASNPKELGQILADIGSSAVASLIDDLADANPRRRLCTAWILGRMGTPAASAAPVLAGLLERDELSIARQSALALAEVAPLEETTRITLERELERALKQRKKLVGALHEALARLCLNRVRLGVEQEIGARLFALGDEAFVPAVEACGADEPVLREIALRHLRLRYAALALGMDPGLPAVQRDPGALRAELNRRDPGLRARAALEIAHLGARGVELLPLLGAYLHDPHAGVALSARLALLHVVRCVALEGAHKTP